jgi:hypothetical protein
MGGVGLLIFIILFFALRRGGASSLPKVFWQVAFWKFLMFVAVLPLIAMTGLVGVAVLVLEIILLLAPALVLRWIVVPLGVPRVAYWGATYCWPFEVIHESSAGAAFYGALALTRRPSSTQAIDWLEESVNRAQPVRGAGVVAAGLLAALRGDRHRARCLFLVADGLHRKLIPKRVRAIARDWLVVDAARIGNWHGVIRLGRRGYDDSLRWSYAIARIGERLSGDPRGCWAWRLWLCWLVAPRRLATFALLRRALAVPRAPKQAAAEPAVAADLPEALARLASLLENRYAHDGRSFAASVCAVDAALDGPATRTLVGQRLLALGACSEKVESGSLQDMRPPEDATERPDVDALMSGVRARLADLLVPLIEESPMLTSGEVRGPILDQAVERVRLRLFRDIEAQCKDYNDRLKGETSLPTVAEWETWALMRDAANRVLELDPESEIALFHAMYVPVCNFAVFQHNKCMRRTLAHEIYSWLHRHSQSDPSAAQLLLGNVRASEA